MSRPEPDMTGSVATRVGRAIQLDEVSKRYGDFIAVDGLNLEIAAGELVTLLGPSGSGKTTTLMMVAGFTTPSFGRIQIGERNVTHLPTHRRDLGVVFQQYALFPHMTVAENVAFALRMRGVGRSEREERVARALDLVEMQRFAPRFPSELSGGQQQRVAFARAIVFDPPVLLLDEPLGALDKRLRETLQIEIKALHARLGLTMIYVTHDQGEALAISDRVVVMNEGRLEQVGPPAELYEAPVSRFVADFIGDANFIPATVRELSGDRVLLSGPNDVPLAGCSAFGAAGAMLEPGAAAEVMIRPERLHPLSPGQPNEGPQAPTNTLSGTVLDQSYLGATTRVHIRLDAGLIVSLQLGSRRDRQLDLSAGSRVTLRWDADDALVFPDKARREVSKQTQECTG